MPWCGGDALRGPQAEAGIAEAARALRGQGSQASKTTLAYEILACMPEVVQNTAHLAQTLALANQAAAVLEGTGKAAGVHQSIKLRYALVRKLVSLRHLDHAGVEAAALCGVLCDSLGPPVPAGLASAAAGAALSVLLCAVQTGDRWIEACTHLVAMLPLLRSVCCAGGRHARVRWAHAGCSRDPGWMHGSWLASPLAASLAP